MMEKQQRLIDADALMKNIGKIPQLRGITYSRMKRAVEETPTIDAVPVVRCKECKHSTTFHHTGNMYCGLHENHHFLTDADGFCNKGERRCDNE